MVIMMMMTILMIMIALIRSLYYLFQWFSTWAPSSGVGEGGERRRSPPSCDLRGRSPQLCYLFGSKII